MSTASTVLGELDRADVTAYWLPVPGGYAIAVSPPTGGPIHVVDIAGPFDEGDLDTDEDRQGWRIRKAPDEGPFETIFETNRVDSVDKVLDVLWKELGR